MPNMYMKVFELKRILAVILSIVLIMGILPLGVVADSNDDWKEYLLEELREAETGKIDVSKYNVTFDEIAYFLNYDIYYSYPEISYYFDWIYEAYYKGGTEYAGSFKLSYLYDSDDIEEMQENVEEVIEPAIKGINKNWTDLQKALYLHDWLCVNYMYDLRLYDENEYENVNYDMYSFLTEGRGVCQAYAFSYLYLLRLCGIESRFVESDEDVHGWNVVKIDGNWYHVDITHDDPVIDYDATTDFLGKACHDHFMLSDSELEAVCDMHTDWYDPMGVVGSCESYKGNAYWKNVETSIIQVEKNWYYVDYSMGGLVKTRDFVNKERVVQIGEEYNGDYLWVLSDNSGIPAYFTGLYEMNGHLFFNDSTKIYSYDTHFGRLTTVYELDESKADRIYGMSLKDKTIDYITDIDYTLTGTLEHFYKLGNHMFISDWFVTKEATDTEDGEQVRMCYICGEVVESKTIPCLSEDKYYGDADGDGTVTTKDLATEKLFLAGGFMGVLSKFADVNRDGVVDTKDLATLKLFLAGALKL